jgi:hypothetical protein
LMGLWAYFELGHANVVAAAYKSKMIMSVIRFACSDLARAFFPSDGELLHSSYHVCQRVQSMRS